MDIFHPLRSVIGQTSPTSPGGVFHLHLPRVVLDSSLIFHDEMVAVGLFYFHLFFFIRASHKEAFDPGMGGEGARRVKDKSKKEQEK